MSLDDDLKQSLALAIQSVRADIRWKPRKAQQHLKRRIDFEHLPSNTTLADYEKIIYEVLHSPIASLYIFKWDKDIYPTVTATHEGKVWLVMLGLSGIMETAFPPDDPDEYLADARFEDLGNLLEFLT